MKNRIRHFKSFLDRFFLQMNQLDQNFQLLFLFVEEILYVVIINEINILQLFKYYEDGFIMLISLCTLCVAKYFMRKSMAALYGLLALQILVQSSNRYVFINLFLLGALYIAEILSITTFDFNLQSVQSQSRNQNKIFHRLLLIENVILLTLVQNQVYIHVTSFVFFLMLFISKEKSLIKCDFYREISLRFYVWAALDHLKLFLGSFFPTDSPIAFLITLVISQIVYTIYSFCRKQVNFYELMAKEQYLQLNFYVLKYHLSDYLNECPKSFAKFLASQQDFQINSTKCQGIFQMVLSKLERVDGFFENLLKAEVHIINGHLLTAKVLLVKLKNNLKWYAFLHRFLIYRMESSIKRRFAEDKMNVTLIYQKQFTIFLSFQELLYKAATQNLKLNYYLTKEGVELEKVKAISKKIIYYQIDIDRKYEEIQNYFIVSTQYYIVYLILIKNDYPTAKQTLNKHIISQKYLFDFKLDEKIYIKLTLQEQGMNIAKVGFSSKQLLDYDRNDLEGQMVERIIPSFYRDEHRRICQNFIHQKFDQIYLFQKRTAILNNKNTYTECNIILKLNYSPDEQFYYEGYIQVLNSQSYNINKFFYVNLKGRMLECSENVFDWDKEQENNINICQYFDQNQIGQPLNRITMLGIETFDPILTFNGSEQYFFYAKKYSKRDQRSRNRISLKKLQYIKQSQKITPQSKHFEKTQQKIRNNQIIILLSLICFFLCSLFVSQYLIIYSAYIKFNHQNFVVESGQNLMLYYNDSFVLGMDMTYVDLRDNYGYEYSFQEDDPIATALELQSMNENLKQFNIGKYSVPSTNNPLIKYSQSNYEIVGIILSNSVAYNKFINDSFAASAALDGLRSVLPVFFMSSFTDYRISVFSLMASFVKNDQFYDRLSLGVNIANISIFIFIAIRLYIKLKQIEEITLEFRCSSSSKIEKIEEILQFLKELTIEEISIQKFNFQTNFIDNYSNAQTDSVLVRTEMSLIKESTARNLNDSVNKAFEQLTKESGIKRAPKKFWFIKTKSYRPIILIFAIFTALLLSLVVINHINNNIIRDVDETASITSIVTLYRASAFYSRAILHSLNTMIAKNLKNIDNSKYYYTAIKSYNTYLAGFTLLVFPETKFSEFAQYTIGLNQLYQKQICTYTPCDPLYHDQINLNFITVINYLSTNLSRLVSDTINLNSSSFAAYLNLPQTINYINILFQSQMLIRAFVIDLSMIYLENYGLFMNNLLYSKLNYVTAMIVITAIAFLLYIYMVVFIRKQQELLISIIKIYG